MIKLIRKPVEKLYKPQFFKSRKSLERYIKRLRKANVRQSEWEVVLTAEQREQLDKLWFIYGNRGPKFTMSNHKFIQGLLEGGHYWRTFYEPTDECANAVDHILFDGDEY